MSYKLGQIYMKAIRPQCSRILELSLLASVTCPPLHVYIMVVLDHNPTTFLANKRFAWNPTWHIWIVLAKIIGSFFETTLEDRPRESCDMNLGLH